MITKGLAEAALELIGTPYRLHGRQPERGLDCVGLLAAALERIGRPHGLPNGYRMRTRHCDGLAQIAEQLGFMPTVSPLRDGDVVLLRPAPCQLHLGIVAHGGGLIHAHAGLRRVVLSPLPPAWPIAGHWRLSQTD